MIIQTYYVNVRDAADHIKKILAELPYQGEISIIHSVNSTDCFTEVGTWDGISESIVDFLRDLDAQHGKVIYDAEEPPCWDFLDMTASGRTVGEWEVGMLDVCVEGGEGVVVTEDTQATGGGTFPVCVFKTSFWRSKSNVVLKTMDEGVDFSATFSPAIYFELLGER